ncbi:MULTISPECIES: hypothetical protein [Nonlabens]|uniref:Uncharacterized protein n=1 Tax=Nonlabens xylanidelens TaxID=191564 RepID=A0A2S6IL56_9FLAO|nr:hypothetical protein [Nonlabens xylanidelens]PPK94938.1 hypothetical protein LY01_01691 [Nonlabens xylanidelens]PQJ17485.1 hypothetical protein BST94_10525 [Nonlabens xylanidelens]
MQEAILPLLQTLLPAFIIAVISYYFFSSFMKNEEKRRRFITVRESQAKTLPTRMAAYERLVLFLERIKPASLVVRTKPGNLSKSEYEQGLIAAIEHEFEHNIAQQVYVSEECWNIIRAAKNTTIQKLRQVSMTDKVTTADGLRQAILNDLMDKRAPSATAISFLKTEVNDLF